MNVSKPNFNDTLIRNILNHSLASQAVLVAHELNLFEAIGNFNRTADEICQITSLPKKSVLSLLTISFHYRLIENNSDKYKLTPYAKEYLLKNSSFYFGDVLNLLIRQNKVRSYQAIREGILTGNPQVYNGKGLFETHELDINLLQDFTKAMHAKSLGPATAWPQYFHLGGDGIFLDIGGGAGTHSIHACLRWPKLRAIIYERPEVGKLASQYIKNYDLENNISVFCGDIWRDSFPNAQIHFYSDIFHDWPLEKCSWLADKSFASLPKNGRIVIHEMLYNREKIETFNVAVYNLNMMLWTHGQQFSGEELKKILKKSGFVNIKIKKTFGDWHIIIGRKP